jgi:NAD(P)-dependent dehydrogenase (short-subunit alcohol dehydrogenase family)
MSVEEQLSGWYTRLRRAKDVMISPACTSVSRQRRQRWADFESCLSPRRPRRAAFAGAHGEVREIVEAGLYLELATFVTGETLHVDGGAHAGHR